MTRTTRNSYSLLRSNKGLSLLEVLFTIVILGLVVSSVTYLSGTYRTSHQSEQQLTAVEIAQTKLENLQAALYNDVQSTSTPIRDTSFSDYWVTVQVSDATQAAINVSNVSPGTLKYVKVTVEYRGTNGTMDPVVMDTLIAKR